MTSALGNKISCASRFSSIRRAMKDHLNQRNKFIWKVAGVFCRVQSAMIYYWCLVVNENNFINSNFQPTKIPKSKPTKKSLAFILFRKALRKIWHSKSECLWHEQTGSFNVSHQLNPRRLLKYDLFCLTFLPRLLWIVAEVKRQNKVSWWPKPANVSEQPHYLSSAVCFHSLPRIDILNPFSYNSHADCAD